MSLHLMFAGPDVKGLGSSARAKSAKESWAALAVRLSSPNRKHLKPAEQMAGEDLRASLRTEAINQVLTAAARHHVMLTQHDKYNYWPMRKEKNTLKTKTVQAESRCSPCSRRSKTQQLIEKTGRCGDLLINEINLRQTVPVGRRNSPEMCVCIWMEQFGLSLLKDEHNSLHAKKDLWQYLIS